MIPAVVHVASGREWRGGQRQVWLLARELQRLGAFEQVVVTGAGSELARRLADDGVPVRAVAWRAGLDLRALIALRAELRRNPAAVVHAHDAHALTLAGLARLGRPVPLVVTRRVVFPLRRRGLWTRADRVIAISPAVRTALVASGVAPDRIELVPSGIDLEGLTPAPPQELRSRLGLPPGTPLAVSIAALTPEKDHATLLDAAALVRRGLPDLHWALLGEGPLRAVVEERIARLGLGDRVHLLGGLPDPDRLLAGATLLVLSSTAEGFGSVALAAWAQGVPIVACRAGGLGDLLEGGAGLLAPPRDPPALATTVRRGIVDPALRAELVERGRAEVRHYSARGMAERILAVYRSCGLPY